jgi:hypothetical protein
LNVSVFASLAKAYKKRVYDYNIYNTFNINKSIFLELLYEVRQKVTSDYNIINIFQKTDLYSFNPFIIFEKLRSRSTIFSNIIIIIDIFGNRIEITINYLIMAKKINIIIEKIRKGSRNSLLFKEFYNVVIKIKTDYTLAYKICDDMIDAARRRRRTTRSRKNYREAKYLTVARIKVIEKNLLPRMKLNVKKRKNIRRYITKESWHNLYGRKCLLHLTSSIKF